MNCPLLRQAGAIAPVAMSLAALALVLGHAAIFGVTHEADEGTPAHIFQLLMAAQVPVVAFFAIKWLPQRPSQALCVMVLQAFAGILALAAVHWLT